MIQLNYVTTTDGPKVIELNRGTPLFAVGPNGAGKSSLVQLFYTQHGNIAKKIAAHRQTWIGSNTLDVTPHAKKQMEKQLQGNDADATSRYRDNYAAQRINAAIFDLINAENVRSRDIAKAIDEGALELAIEHQGAEMLPEVVASALGAKREESPLKLLNEILRTSNIDIEIFVMDDEQLMARRGNYPPYGIVELSDGERNAILICASVLTSAPGTLIIVDEPERHLHRSIISPMLSTLFQKRDDCYFIVSTHDVHLPMDNSDSMVVLVRPCEYNGQTARTWEADQLEPGAEIDSDIKLAILGAKRTVLFVEGSESSLDKQLYEIIFPGVSVVAKGSCAEVERSTKGLRGNTELAWSQGCGLIDADDRSLEQLDLLRANGIFSLPCYSIESIYYHPHVMNYAAEKLAEVTGADWSASVETAVEGAFQQAANNRERLCARRIERSVKNLISTSCPDHNFIRENEEFTLSISLTDALNAELAKFDQIVADTDYAQLVMRYPLRETGAFGAIASAIGFNSKSQYQGAVRKLVVESEEARSALSLLIPGLEEMLPS